MRNKCYKQERYAKYIINANSWYNTFNFIIYCTDLLRGKWFILFTLIHKYINILGKNIAPRDVSHTIIHNMSSGQKSLPAK